MSLGFIAPGRDSGFDAPEAIEVKPHRRDSGFDAREVIAVKPHS